MKVSIILSLYRVEEFLVGYFENALSQKNIENIEFSIVHNDPTKKEKEIIDQYASRLNMVYQEVKLESLYKSWNRAITQSSGKYLSCWNVDDLRVNDSVERMSVTLDNNPDVGFTYGDFLIVNKFGKSIGKNISTPEFTKHLGTTGAIGGPFFMWRRSLIKDVGYFDEQFKSGSDFDYTVRLSIFSVGKKTKGRVGYFLNTSNGISTKNKSLQAIERTAIELRYAIWYKIDVNYIGQALSYNINTIISNDRERGIDSAIVSLANDRKIWFLLTCCGYIKGRLISLVKKIIHP